MANNGQEYSYDYGMAADQKYTPNTLWNAEGADPLADVIAMQDVIENKGYARPRRAITSRAVVRALMKNAGIKEALRDTRFFRKAASRWSGLGRYP